MSRLGELRISTLKIVCWTTLWHTAFSSHQIKLQHAKPFPTSIPSVRRPEWAHQLWVMIRNILIFKYNLKRAKWVGVHSRDKNNNNNEEQTKKRNQFFSVSYRLRRTQPKFSFCWMRFGKTKVTAQVHTVLILSRSECKSSQKIKYSKSGSINRIGVTRCISKTFRMQMHPAH